MPVYALFRASILDFRAKLANRCKLFQVYTIFRASILDFKPRLENRCKLFPVYTLIRASILDFRAKLANRCRVSPAEFVVSTVFRVRFYSSLLQRRMARLLRPSRQQPSASDSNFRSYKEEWPACYDRCGSNLPRPILIFEAEKKNGPPATSVATTCFRVQF